MAQLDGYIQLHRKIMDWEWFDDTNTLHVFITLLLLASYRDSSWRGIPIPRGSLVTSYPSLAKKTGLSIQNVRTAIKKLKTTGELTVKTYSKFSVISLNNYSQYQGPNSQLTGNQQGTNRELTGNQQHLNKGNKYNKGKKEKNTPYSPPTDNPAAARAVGAVVSSAEKESVIDRVMHEHIGATDF